MINTRDDVPNIDWPVADIATATPNLVGETGVQGVQAGITFRNMSGIDIQNLSNVIDSSITNDIYSQWTTTTYTGGGGGGGARHRPIAVHYTNTSNVTIDEDVLRTATGLNSKHTYVDFDPWYTIFETEYETELSDPVPFDDETILSLIFENGE